MPPDPQLQRQFESAVDEHAAALYRVACRLTGHHHLAGELVQETYLQAWQGLGSLHDRAKLKSWLFGILRFQYSKLVRREARISNLPEGDADSLAAPGSGETGELVDQVQAAVAELADEHRFPILLVSMEGLTVDEAAAILELPRGTVLSRLHRGRQKLKEILQRTADVES